MLTKAQQSLIRSLRSKKGRQKNGLCLVEGAKNIAAAGDAVQFQFDDTDPMFTRLVTTEQPQSVAAVAAIPEWEVTTVTQCPTLLVLDYVQDPGNVGAIFRLAQGFNATVVLIESADPTNSKVIRSSAGAMFQVPWITLPRAEAADWITQLPHNIFRLEKRTHSVPVGEWAAPEQAALIVGSEGNGIQLPVEGISIVVEHNKALESLNVGHATAIALATRYSG